MQQINYNFFIQWHLTERCNLRCRHCYQGLVGAELDHSTICRNVDSIRDMLDSWEKEYGMVISPSFHFTGGEPFLRDDLFSILEYAKNREFSLSLMSNGTLITDTLAKQLGEAGITDVQISLDGLEQTHDSIRGVGNFTRALSGIEKLLTNGIETFINLTLSRLNINELEGMVTLAEEIGINAVTFSRLVSCGRGEELFDQMLTAEELADLYHRLPALNTTNVTVSSLDPLAIVAGMDGEITDTDFPVGGCSAGIFGLTITSEGNIMPCRRMDYVIGNVMTDDIRQVWVESPVLIALRKREAYHDGCDTCYYWPVCRGCRAIALAVSRNKGSEDFLGPDPQCSYYKRRLVNP